MDKTPISEVFCEDNMIGMARYPDKFFDLMLVDPPYFSGPEKRRYYGEKESKLGIKKVYRNADEWTLPGAELLAEVERVSKAYIFWGCNYFNFPFHTGRIVWDKVNDSSDYSDCEIAATNLFDHVRIFRYMWNGMLQGESITNGSKMQGNKKLNEKRIHPTQKPVALYRWILSKYANPGFKIGDTHMGSQSSRIAAFDLGLDFWGWDKDVGFFDDGNSRFKKATAQIKAFHHNAIH